MKLLLPAVSAVVLFAATAVAQEFTANNLFVVSSGDDTVRELNSTTENLGATTTAVATLGSATDLNNAHGAAFGPDGRLYVATADPADAANQGQIVAINPDGSVDIVVAPTGDLKEPRGLAFGHSGHLFCASNSNNWVAEYTIAGTQVNKVGNGTLLTAPFGVAIGPNSHIYVTSNGVADGVFEFLPDEPTSPIRLITGGAQAIDDPRGVAFGPRGHLFVGIGGAGADAGKVFEIDQDGQTITTFGPQTITDIRYIAFGPDGHMWLTALGAGAAPRVFAFSTGESPDNDPLGTLVANVGSGLTFTEPTGIAFAPFRFGVNLSGRMQTTGVGALKKKKENFNKKTNVGPILTIAPGSRTLTLTLTDDVANTSDLATLLGRTTQVFHGYTTQQDLDEKVRTEAGHEFPEPSLDIGSSTIDLVITGTVGAVDGEFTPTKFSGRLLRQARNVIYGASVKSVERLK